MGEVQPVQVEVNAEEFGETGVYLVGLPDATVKESKDDVSSARKARAMTSYPFKK